MTLHGRLPLNLGPRWWLLGLVLLVVSGVLLLLTACDAPEREPNASPDSLVVTWDARPGDLAYRLYLSTNDTGTDLMVDLPAGVTRHAWPLTMVTSRWPRDSVQVSVCLNRRIDSTVPITDDDAGWAPARCEETWYQPPKPPPELRLRIGDAGPSWPIDDVRHWDPVKDRDTVAHEWPDGWWTP